MSKSSNVDYLLSMAGRSEAHQRIRIVRRVDGINKYEPNNDPNMVTVVKVY